MNGGTNTQDTGVITPTGGPQAPNTDADTPGDGAGEVDWEKAGPVYYKLLQQYMSHQDPSFKAARRTSEQRKEELNKLRAEHAKLKTAYVAVSAAFDYTWDNVVSQRLDANEQKALETELRQKVGAPQTQEPESSQKADPLEAALRRRFENAGIEWGDPRIDVGPADEDAAARLESVEDQIGNIQKFDAELQGAVPEGVTLPDALTEGNGDEGTLQGPTPPRHKVDLSGGQTAPGTRLTPEKLRRMTPEQVAKLDQKDVDRVLRGMNK